MATVPTKSAAWTDFEYLQAGREILARERKALETLQANLPLTFADAVRSILNCSGAVLVTGSERRVGSDRRSLPPLPRREHEVIFYTPVRRCMGTWDESRMTIWC
jgi:hypothetical protein